MITNSQKNNEFRVQLDVPENAFQPDVFVSSHSLFPAQNFVISRTKTGEVLSVYGDDVWNLTPYHPRGTYYPISFSKCIERINGVNPLNVEQMKQLIFLLMYKSPSLVSVKTLLHYHHLNFDLIKFSHKNNCLISDLLSQEDLIKSLIRSLAGSKLKHLKSMIIKFIQIGIEDTGFEAIGGAPLKDLTNLKIQICSGALPFICYLEFISK